VTAFCTRAHTEHEEQQAENRCPEERVMHLHWCLKFTLKHRVREARKRYTPPADNSLQHAVAPRLGSPKPRLMLGYPAVSRSPSSALIRAAAKTAATNNRH